MKTRKIMLLACMLGIFTIPMASVAFADEETKPPIIVKQGNTTYKFTSQNEKFRSMLLNSKNLRIHQKSKKNWEEDYYKNYYRHHRNVPDYETPAYYSGYAAGYRASKNRDD